MRILVIDGDPIARDVMQQMLEILGHYVFAAACWEKGVDRFDDSIKMVITDLHLGSGHMDGNQICDAIKQLNPKVFVACWYGGGHVELQKSFDYVLRKPSTILEVKDKLLAAYYQK